MRAMVCKKLSHCSFLAAGWLCFAGPVAGNPTPAGGAPDSFAKSLVIELDSPRLASQGDVHVTVQELKAFLELNVEDADRQAFLRGEERLASVLRNMLRTRAVASAALEEGLLQEPTAAAETYDAAMNFLARKQLDRVAKRSELSDYQQQARERYLRDPEKFREAVAYSFTHLLVSDETPGSEAEETLEEIRAQLEQGTPFNELVLEYSDDPSVSRNRGAFENVTADDLDEAFLTALESLNVGTVSDPVRTRFGWHLIRVDKISPSRIPPFEEVAAELREKERSAHRQTIKERYVESLTDKPLKINEVMLEELRENVSRTTSSRSGQSAANQ